MDSKKSKPIQIGRILEGLLADNRQKQRSPQSIIMDNWGEIVGTDNTIDSMPFSIKNKILTILVSNSSLLHYFTLKKIYILDKVKEKINSDAVKDVRFKIGEINAGR